MKIISFNIRGVGSRLKNKEVSDFIQTYKINICCLQETKIENIYVIYAEKYGEEKTSGGQSESRQEGQVEF